MPLPPSAGVIGWPVAHSKSPLIHRFWLTKLGIDGDYGRFPVHPDSLGTAIRALPALGLRGVNVTVPHKVAVMDHLDRVDPVAARIGAVNTVVVEAGELVGYNTDARGFMEPLGDLASEGSSPPGTAVIIGAGGAARAIAIALSDAGCFVFILNRDLAKAQALAASLAPPGVAASLPLGSGGTSIDLRIAGAVLLVNATSLGMTGNPPLNIDFTQIDPNTIAYDIVYQPLETPLLAAARARGMRTIDGLQMLVGQAAAAFELFFGQPAPRQHDAELRALLTA